MVIKTRKDIAAYVAANPEVVDTKAAYEEDEPGGFKEIERMTVSLIALAKDRPAYGTDWGEWLEDNIDEMLQEAIGIVM